MNLFSSSFGKTSGNSSIRAREEILMGFMDLGGVRKQKMIVTVRILKQEQR